MTQRVVVDPPHGYRRDCLDQVWTKFLLRCDLVPVPMPNTAEAALTLCEKASICGIVLTGGNDLAAYGGDAPDRDATESALLDFAERRGLPVLGVCRGMQIIQHHFGIPLRQVDGHIASRQCIHIEGKIAEVNSFHKFGSMETRAPLKTWAIADDGVVKAIRHEDGRIIGMMWHPERLDPFNPVDVALFSQVFQA
ncbi:MAG: gamma-glutamyl-gamma-aminobutyrate hydrolase family protein [Xanthobacteraceae bacterium]